MLKIRKIFSNLSYIRLAFIVPLRVQLCITLTVSGQVLLLEF